MDASKVSKIKRLNERTAEIRRKFGTESPEYQRARRALEIVGGDHLTKSGNISHGKKAVESISDRALDAALSRMTAGQMLKEYRRGAAREEDVEEDEVTQEAIEAYRSMINDVKERTASGDKFLMSDAIRAFKQDTGVDINADGRPSYAQLQAALDHYDGLERTEREKIRNAALASEFVDVPFDGDTFSAGGTVIEDLRS